MPAEYRGATRWKRSIGRWCIAIGVLTIVPSLWYASVAFYYLIPRNDWQHSRSPAAHNLSDKFLDSLMHDPWAMGPPTLLKSVVPIILISLGKRLSRRRTDEPWWHGVLVSLCFFLLGALLLGMLAGDRLVWSEDWAIQGPARHF